MLPFVILLRSTISNSTVNNRKQVFANRSVKHILDRQFQVPSIDRPNCARQTDKPTHCTLRARITLQTPPHNHIYIIHGDLLHTFSIPPETASVSRIPSKNGAISIKQHLRRPVRALDNLYLCGTWLPGYTVFQSLMNPCLSSWRGSSHSFRPLSHPFSKSTIQIMHGGPLHTRFASLSG